MPSETPYSRLNTWSLDALIERSPHNSRAEVARDARIATSTLSDIMSHRRQPSRDVMARLAETVDVDERAIAADPYGVLPPLERLLAAARRLEPHLNGHDFGLRKTLAELEELGL